MTKPGRHRFVMLRDLLDFREEECRVRNEALGRMIDSAEHDDLYTKTDGARLMRTSVVSGERAGRPVERENSTDLTDA